MRVGKTLQTSNPGGERMAILRKCLSQKKPISKNAYLRKRLSQKTPILENALKMPTSS